jgi:uridylate kinase
MDLSAIELIKDKDIEIRVFSMSDPENIIRAANNEKLGTVCKKGE